MEMSIPLSKRDALKEIDDAGVMPRQRWRYYKDSHVVTIVAVGINKVSLEPTVGYAGADGVVWFTPLSMFIGRAKLGEGLVPRFALCDD